MEKADVFATDAELELTQSLHEWCTFNIANCPTQLNHTDIGCFARTITRLCSHTLNPFLDFIGNVRDHLDCFSKIVTLALTLDHSGVDFSGGQVVVSTQADVKETFVIAKIQINLATVIKDENFAMLEWAHCSCITV